MVVWISSSEKLSRETQMFVGAIVLLWNLLTRPALDLEFSPQDAKNVKTREFFACLVFTTEFQYQSFSANLWSKCGTFIWERSAASVISLLCWNWGKLLSKMNWGQLLSNKNTPHPEALISRAPSHWPSEDATSRGPLRVLLHELEIVCNRAWWCEKDFCCSGEGGICLYLISNCFPRSEKINRISETGQDSFGVTGDAQTNRTSTRFPF